MADEKQIDQILTGPAEVKITTPAGVAVRITLPPDQTAGIATKTSESDGNVSTFTTIKTGPYLGAVEFKFPPPRPRTLTCLCTEGKFLGYAKPDKDGKITLPPGTVTTMDGPDPGGGGCL